MSKNPKKYLYDVAQAIDIIFLHHLQGVESLADFEASITVQNAVERQIGIIGEAIYRLRQQGLTLTDTDNIINFRNTLIHQYDKIKVSTLWTFTQRLPALKTEVDQLLAREE
ncbi:MAG: HepT-like ribonuclease domain-containing protein [Bacteroidia bacterium]